MQATAKQGDSFFYGFTQAIAWFLLVPLLSGLLILLGVFWLSNQFQNRYAQQVFTGVTVWDEDASGLTPQQLSARLEAKAQALLDRQITLVDPETNQKWQYRLGDLGVSVDTVKMSQQAYQIGRDDSMNQINWQESIRLWYHGAAIPPSITIDETPSSELLGEIAMVVNRSPVDAALDFQESGVSYTNAQTGRVLDTESLYRSLISTISELHNGEIVLPLVDVSPRIATAEQSAEMIQEIISTPITFYFERPIEGVDLSLATLSPEQLAQWVQINSVTQEDGTTSLNATLNRAAVTEWIQQFAPLIAREPKRARFYFDDYTKELVLIAPHENGRYLDVEATTDQVLNTFTTNQHTIPFVVKEIIPDVHSAATAAELGITQEITKARATTSFYGSSSERMVNIARAASNYYGIVVAPGEKFSFNHYLGEISEEQGYSEGLIISGGRTIKGVGGGVCQVSTTLYQAAFWGGYDLSERTQHAYRVGYYETDPNNVGIPNLGMDATVYSPIVDMTFVNNTPHYLLMENYYDEGSMSLTFKFYSTDIGRRIERKISVLSETPAKPDIYEFNPELKEGEIKQVDWAVKGANVLVERWVYNQWGELREYRPIQSNYIPWANVYQYGPGVDLRRFSTPTPAPLQPAEDPNATPLATTPMPDQPTQGGPWTPTPPPAQPEPPAAPTQGTP